MTESCLPTLTDFSFPFNLLKLNRSLLDPRDSAAVPFSCRTSIGWEVVQLVGHQTLTLGILVRVQASQPNLVPSELGPKSIAPNVPLGRNHGPRSRFSRSGFLPSH